MKLSNKTLFRERPVKIKTMPSKQTQMEESHATELLEIFQDAQMFEAEEDMEQASLVRWSFLDYYSFFITDIIKAGLVFSISNFFTTKTSMTNKWISNSALEGSQVIFLLSW